MTEILVPTAAPLQRLANVQLMHTGSWQASTGTHEFTVDDLKSAATAFADCPSVHRPVLKLGHTDERYNGDGQPSIGYVDNLRTEEDGRTLTGDYAGMPSWFTPEVLASAYSQRSIEGEWDYKCQLGHVHPFVVSAVALLGVEPPAIGTLNSLQDIANLYAVTDQPTGEPTMAKVTLTGPSKTVAASVTSEDIRRAFYDANPDYYTWVEEIQMTPELQLIVVDDNDGKRTRVPVIISGEDGSDAVEFGDPVDIVIRYEDVAGASEETESATVAATRGKADRVVFASRDASRKVSMKGESVTTLAEALRAKLGITDSDPSDDALLAAVGDLLGTEETVTPEPAATVPATPVAEPAADADVVLVPAAELAALRANASLGAEAHATLAARERDSILTGAVRAGKFAPAQRNHFEALLSADPKGTQALIDGLAPGTVPVEEVGHNHGGVSASAGDLKPTDDPKFKNWSM